MDTCKKCRRAGEKLFLKGERCELPKCAIVKRNYAPGVHGGKKQKRSSEYGTQLAVKQRLKHAYGLREQQLKNYFSKVKSKTGDVGELLLQKLEMRLDNLVYRSGVARSRREARQMVNHGMFLVQGKEVDIPSYGVRVGDAIQIKESKKKPALQERLKDAAKKTPPAAWINVDHQKGEIKIMAVPSGQEIGEISDIGMVVEYYSR